LQATKEQRTSW